jgi:2-phosphoglycerate kinase
MTLEPAHNKYIRFFDNIRAIQSHVISAAEGHMFPRIDNTNVDRRCVR